MQGARRALAAVCCAAALWAAATVEAQSDLDAFMRQVLAARDGNWKKLQQYVLDERETIDLRGPGNALLWGGRREYTWFIRDGFFVRSPLKIDGVSISEGDRRKYETDFLAREQRREARRSRGAQAAETPTPGDEPGDVPSLLRQSREPEFISSAYFLRFRFEQGKYALVGRETLDGRDLLRIEYYPTNLFRGTDRRRREQQHCIGDNCGGSSEQDKAYDAEFRRLMNKTALVTLWIEPAAHQIVKYTFDNVALDFLPASWLLRLDELHASMTMSQPFPDVWLPAAIDLRGALTLAAGQFDLRYGVEYHDYRRADVSTRVKIPKER